MKLIFASAKEATFFLEESDHFWLKIYSPVRISPCEIEVNNSFKKLLYLHPDNMKNLFKKRAIPLFEENELPLFLSSRKKRVCPLIIFFFVLVSVAILAKIIKN